VRNGVVALLLAVAGCGVSSQLPADAALATLDPGAAAQLCRFTSDSLAETEETCVSFTRDYDTCVGDPPWDECPAGDRPADVASWEACVRAASACEASADSCWHVSCP